MLAALFDRSREALTVLSQALSLCAPFWFQCWPSPAALSSVVLTLLIPLLPDCSQERRGGTAHSSGQPHCVKNIWMLGNPCQGSLSVKRTSKTIISHGIPVINIITTRCSCSQSKVMKGSVLRHSSSCKNCPAFLTQSLQEQQLPLGLLNSHFSHWTIVDHYEVSICENAASHTWPSSR